MPTTFRTHRRLGAVLLALASHCSHAADDDAALDLQAAEPAKAAAVAAAAPAGGGLQLALEAAGLFAKPAGGGATDTGHRLAIDLRYSGALAPGWRFSLSDRLEDIEPAPSGQRRLRNHLREAALAWQSDSGQRAVEFGRVNLRHGPAYGYNPTDYFRLGATQSLVTADPVALRRNRTGTFMVRASQSWEGGGVSLALAPQLTRSGPRDGSFDLGLAGTNASHRLLLTTQWQPSQRWNGEALLFVEDGGPVRIGANATGLLTDAAVLHAEWSAARLPSMLDTVLGTGGARQLRHQASVGLTYAWPSGLSLTAEAQFNGAGLSRSGWQQLFAKGPLVLAPFFGRVQADQELATRQAWLLYASQKGLWLKQLDLNGFVRINQQDHSRLMWAELRYHWSQADLAVQWQQVSGAATTEYGAAPYRRVVQLVGTWFF